MARVLVLGGTGMLGSMTDHYFRSQTSHEVWTTVRRERSEVSKTRMRHFDADEDAGSSLRALLEEVQPESVINCIGVIKPYCRDDDADGVKRAIRLNAFFPHRLAAETSRVGATVLQIATDCVFSGRTGGYDETAPHDALDVYGKTKSLGEVRAPNVLHLRCSIVGPERERQSSLLEWLLHQKEGSEVRGFTHHRWNGVTTLQFAKLCATLVERGSEGIRQLIRAAPVQHVVLNSAVTKSELLRLFVAVFHRSLTVLPVEDSGPPVDRTLATRYQYLVDSPGVIPMEQAVEELRAYIEKWGLRSSSVAEYQTSEQRTVVGTAIRGF